MNTLDEQLRSFERKQVLFSAMALFASVVCAVTLSYFVMENRAEQTTQIISRMIQIGDFREVGSTLHLARLDYFTKIQYYSAEEDPSFVFPAKAEFDGEQPWWRALIYDTKTVRVGSFVLANPTERIVFEFNRFQYVPGAALLWLILNIISIPQTRFMKKRIKENYSRDLTVQRELALADISKKVRHNIRTPLSALMRLAGRTSQLPEQDQRLFTSVVSQVKALISELEPKNLEGHPVEQGSIYFALRDSFSELHAVFGKRTTLVTELDEHLLSAEVAFVPFEIRSILSNLVANSVETVPPSSRVEIRAIDDGSSICIEVRDNGPGISQSVIGRVTEKHFSFNKANGTGLGLHHAAQSVADWQGTLKINSDAKGTVVVLRLPIVQRSSWYTPSLKLAAHERVVIIDDQETVRLVWEFKLRDAGHIGEIIYFSQPRSIGEEMVSDSVDTLFLVDFDFGKDVARNGFDVIKELPKNARRFLVTGHSDEVGIARFCRDEDVKLIPKSQLADLPILVRPE